jgi:uncharacterized membrane protein
MKIKTSDIQKTSRWLIALSFAAFGVHQLVYGSFVTRAIGALPPWIPWQPVWAYLTGAALILLALAMGKGNRSAAIAIGITCLLSALLLHLPGALAHAASGGSWVFFGKGLTLAGCGIAVAGSLGARPRGLSPQWLIVYAKCALGAFMILSGYLHFVFLAFVVSLFPPWIPGHVFWTYAAAILLICGGIGMMIPMTSKLAALLSGIMILLWVPLIHIPLALKNLHNPSESVPVFEALAFGSVAILAAAYGQGCESGINENGSNGGKEEESAQ